jgi:hypothetical protein
MVVTKSFFLREMFCVVVVGGPETNGYQTTYHTVKSTAEFPKNLDTGTTSRLPFHSSRSRAIFFTVSRR